LEPDDIDLPCPTVDQITEINASLVGGRWIRSPELLESAANQPYQTFSGEDLYPTPFDKAAALIRSIAQNQPFVEGNKRTAWLAARVLLLASGIRTKATTEEIVDLMLRLAAKEVGVDEISTFLLEHASDEVQTPVP
jgi:death-on-curing protein